jgi:16S rRNA processing protein RimM
VPEEKLIVGKVRRAHGTGGTLRVEVLTEFPDRFASGAELELGGRRWTVRGQRAAAQDVLLDLEGMTAAAAQALAGAYLTVPLKDARPLPAGHYYHYQLLGLAVSDTTGRSLGRLAEVLEYPGQDIYRVVDGRNEILIPAARAVVREISLEHQRMVVDWPEPVEAP